ncbi:MAG: Lhr family helicase, partial [Acidimicrobiales bacterium]
PEEAFVGTVNEDWAIESMAGDVFLLGSHTWRIRRIESSTVRVVDANGASPSVPFWLGEAPARTDELSAAVSRLREEVGWRAAESPASAVAWLRETAGLDSRAAEQVVAYLHVACTELGGLPTLERLVVERFFDDTGGMQLVLHSPRGARVNRGLGLALRKRFCRSFDFELQAAASDDAVVLSLGPQHSFPLSEVVGYLSPATLKDTLVQAMLPTPMFGARWRWNLSRSLVSPRFRGTRHLPPAIQRMEADDLMAAIFPMLAACQENVSGPIEIPDHPVVRQTVDDCCTEAMDLASLMSFLDRLHRGEVEAHFVDSVQPSVLCEEILNGRPYTFLDDAPLEERRTRAVTTRRGLPVDTKDLGHLDPELVGRIAEQARPDLRDAEELHDLLDSVVVVEPEPQWAMWFARLVEDGRAFELRLGGQNADGRRWAAAERSRAVASLLPSATVIPTAEGAQPVGCVPAAGAEPLAEDVLVEAVRGHLEVSEPLTPADLADRIGIGPKRVLEVMTALAHLEHEGSVLQCHVGDDSADRYSARHLLMRIHAAARDRSRKSVQAVSSEQLMRFLVEWQHAGAPKRLVGTEGLAEVIEQLQGIEAPIEAWEASILPCRVAGYHAGLLDELCNRGEVGFGRLTAKTSEAGGEAAPARRPGQTPSPATPVGLFRRADLDWLLAAIRAGAVPDLPGLGASAEVLTALQERGALFLGDLCTVTGRMPVEVADALWDGIARGLVTADGFQAVRALLGGRARLGNLVRDATTVPGAASGGASPVRGGVVRQPLPRPGRPRPRVRPALTGGRWSLLGSNLGAPSAGHAGAKPAAETAAHGYDSDELAEAVAGQLLERWGVVFRDLVVRELMGGIGWREVLWALRRFEARGVVRGGRFVGGFTGEQFALPEAYEQLVAASRAPSEGHSVTLSAADPLNLTGIILPGPRIPALRTRTVTITDGAVVDGGAGARLARSGRRGRAV